MLILKHLPINSFNENIAYVHKNCIYFDVKDVRHLTKVEIYGSSRRVFAFLHVTDDEKIVRPSELALNTEAFDSINLPIGAKVSISPVLSLPSTSLIRKKIDGEMLGYRDYENIIDDISSGRYSNMDIAAFLVASGGFMSAPEVLSLTESMISENRLEWEEDEVVDYHSMGGVPSNKVDLIVMAIVAAHGLMMPKTVSRSTTAATGVADVMGVLCNVDLDETTFKKLVRENGVAITNYETIRANEVRATISAVERNIGVMSFEHVVSSILSIKAAAGVTHLLFEIPVGPDARVQKTSEALHLKKLVEYIGDKIGIDIEVVITDGSEPVGRGVGAVLEARDIMKVLLNKSDASEELTERALFVAGKLLEFDPAVRGGKGYELAESILKSGKALDAMNKIIHSQGKSAQPQLGHITKDVFADFSGVIKAIDNSRINQIGILAGSNKYNGAGLDLFKKTGDYVEKGEALFRVHSINAVDFAFVNSAIESYNGYIIDYDKEELEDEEHEVDEYDKDIDSEEESGSIVEYVDFNYDDGLGSNYYNKK